MPNADEETRRRNKDSFQHAALFWIELANQRQSEIVRQLIGLSVILLPLSASVIVANIALDQAEKVLLLVSWVFFITSIFSGFGQILIDSNFFLKLSRDSSKRERLWSDSNKPVLQISKAVDALGEVPGSSADWPLYIQGFTFVIGLILIMVVGIMILFVSHSCPNNGFICIP